MSKWTKIRSLDGSGYWWERDYGGLIRAVVEKRGRRWWIFWEDIETSTSHCPNEEFRTLHQAMAYSDNIADYRLTTTLEALRAK